MSPKLQPNPHSAGVTGRLLGDFGDWLDRLPRWVVLLVSAALIIGVAAVDYITGSEFNVSIFYLGPVVLVTWLVSGWAGLVMALFAGLLWTIVDPGPGAYSNSLIPFWNSLVRMAFAFLMVFLVTLAKRAMVAEHAASHTDSLTKVANARAFNDRARLAIAELRRSRRPLTFCYIDLDHFKSVNDTLGHREGDELLVVLAAAMQSRLRETDLVARLGGDEFGVLLPDTDFDAAQLVLDDVRDSLLEGVAHRWPVTFTAGAITFVQPPSGVDQMVSLADDLMYVGKRAGRNRVERAIWPPAEAFPSVAEVDAPLA